MSVTVHFDSLTEYGAMAMRIVPLDGQPEDMVGEGGQLATRYEQIGRAPLIRVLNDHRVQSVMLADSGMEIHLVREGSQARFSVLWGKDAVIDELVALHPKEIQNIGPMFRPDPNAAVTSVTEALENPSESLWACRDVSGALRWFTKGSHGTGLGEWPLVGTIPAIEPGSLGCESFRRAHGVRMAYVAGAMAGGIASADLVVAMGQAGLIGFFGAGGLPVEAVEASLKTISQTLTNGEAWGANLLNNPHEPAVEEQTVDLYLKYGVTRISASAYMDLSPAVVRYRLTGIRLNAAGAPECTNHVFAKVSRPEVAGKFMRPAPEKMLKTFVEQGILTPEQAEWAKNVPIAEDITAEADSGGHTDHRPALVLLPLLRQQRDAVSAELKYAEQGIRIRVGLAGGLGTPDAIWGAFSMGADYVLTGSVNQACVEAGTSPTAKEMLQQAAFTDVSSGPAPDMFEIGAKVQVLSRGSMYAQRAQRLYDIYKRYDAIEDIPPKERAKIEKQMFKRDLDEVWEGTREYWSGRDPAQVERADKDSHYKMALTFRWYLGMTSRWARMGEADRKRDFQVWCGPSMGGFNAWVNGTELEPVGARRVADVADALMYGAAGQARLSMARTAGLLG